MGFSEKQSKLSEMPDDEEECREATVEETRILEFKLIVNHRLADLMDKMGEFLYYNCPNN